MRKIKHLLCIGLYTTHSGEIHFKLHFRTVFTRKQNNLCLQSDALCYRVFINLPLQQPDSKPEASTLLNSFTANCDNTTEPHLSTVIIAVNLKLLIGQVSFKLQIVAIRVVALQTLIKQQAHTHKRACEQQKISLKVFRISWLRKA